MKFKTASLVFATAATALTALPVPAAFQAGPYHEQHCTRCHDSGVYTRDDRRVQSFTALQAQVARCDANLGTGLFPDDLAALVDHLNRHYYRFPE